MAISSPPVDPRSAEEVVAITSSLVRAYSSWGPRPDGEPDAGSALIRIFGGMAWQVMLRLNQMPDRNFLAFLNLIGASPRPPRAALCPLTFSLAKGTTAPVTVPRGTLVGAGDVVFATTLDLEMTPSRLVAAFVRQPDGDLYTDASARATGADAGSYEVLLGEEPMEHSLYVAADEVLGLAAKTVASVKLDFSPAFASNDALGSFTGSVQWEYWNGSAWAALTLDSTRSVAATSSWSVCFAIPGDMATTSVNGRSARWIRARLTAWPASIPTIAKVTASTASEVTTTAAAPDAAFYNGAPIDLSKDFYPFGQQPQFNDTLYLGSLGALSQPGATVSLNVAISSAYAGPGSTAPTLSWEVWTDGAWELVGTSDKNSTAEDTGLADATAAFTNKNGDEVTFSLTEGLPALAFQGVTSAWLRVRLTGGSYGKGPYLASDGQSVVTTDPYLPPILASVTLACSYTPEVAPTCLTYNDLSFVDQTGAASFVPFTRSADADRALYVGFDQPLGNRSAALYVQVTPLALPGASLSSLKALSTPEPAVVVWEYSRSDGTWGWLGAEDGTRAFAESGLVRFVAPADLAPRVEFGQSLSWIRARLSQGGYAVWPRAGRLLTNTVLGVQASTVVNEVLGSSTAAPHQTFTLTQAPVLAGQAIEVMEPSMPPPDELAKIQEEEGANAVTVVPASGSSPEQIWVRWHEVSSLRTSGPRDRHYLFDFSTGEVSFGDGEHGMVPPAGSGNVRAAWYQTGGGAAGNVAAGAATQMKTSVAYVSGVTNIEPASGGADAESVDRVEDRGPTVLRHRGRAVAAQDFIDLAREASPAVARVCAIAPWFDASTTDTTTVKGAGRVLVVIVPEGADPRPTPGLGLLKDVGSYLRARAAPAVNLEISGPDWIEASVTDLAIVPASMQGAEALATAVDQALTRFFHPLTGGFDGGGWQFGELPHTSDVYRLVGSIEGVDAVLGATLALRSSIEGVEVDEQTADNKLSGALVCSGAHTIRIVPPSEGG